MAYTICRINKVSGWSSVKSMVDHHTRARPTPNADPDKPPIILQGKGDLEVEIRKRIAKEKITPRKNAVLAIEAVLSASPEYFRPSNPNAYGLYQDDRLAPWVKANMSWLKSKYGNLLTSAVLHIDEATPHIHSIIVPLEKKFDHRCNPPRERWGLNARGMIGDKKKLRILQDDYALAMSSLGLERGLSKSITGAEHVHIRKYYENPQAALKSQAQSQRQIIELELEKRKQMYRRLMREYRELRIALKYELDLDGWLDEYDNKKFRREARGVQIPSISTTQANKKARKANLDVGR